MQDIGLLIFRLLLGGTMLVAHGIPKIMNFSTYAEKFPNFLGVGSQVNLSLAIFAEVLCALLVVIGYKTKYVLAPLIVTMAVAFFIVHGEDPFQRKELAYMFMFGYIALLFTGAGKYSVDKR